MFEFKLPSSLTISNCDDILTSAIEAKESNTKIQLDSSEIETIDTAGIQLIFSLCSDHENVSHTNMSEKVHDVINSLGLTVA